VVTQTGLRDPRTEQTRLHARHAPDLGATARRATARDNAAVLLWAMTGTGPTARNHGSRASRAREVTVGGKCVMGGRPTGRDSVV
jgi:hypothetical protein